jgi:competence protein ComEA
VPRAPAAPLALNSATAAELEELPGIGPALAARIVALRDSAGGFRNLDDLAKVRGIGPATLAKLKPLLTL